MSVISIKIGSGCLWVHGHGGWQFTERKLSGHALISNDRKVIYTLEKGLNIINRKEFQDAMPLIKGKYLQCEIYILLHFETN